MTGAATRGSAKPVARRGARPARWLAAAILLSLLVTAPAARAAGEWAELRPIPRVAGEPLTHVERYAPPGEIALAALSCASPRFCIAVGSGSQLVGPSARVYERGYALEFDGSRWRAPMRLHGRLVLTSVSCATARFCVAVGDQANGTVVAGYAAVLGPRGWGAPSLLSGGRHAPDRESEELIQASCVPGGFCAALGSRGATFVLQRGRWRMISAGSSLEEPRRLACLSAWDCVAVVDDEAASEQRFSAGTERQPVFEEAVATTLTRRGWGAPTRLATTGPVTSLTCAGPSFCMATSQLGTDFVYDGRRWGGPEPMNQGSDTEPVSCASASFCVAVDQPESTATFDGRGWGPQKRTSGSSSAVFVLGVVWADLLSCAPPDFCLAIGGARSYDRDAAPPPAR